MMGTVHHPSSQCPKVWFLAQNRTLLHAKKDGKAAYHTGSVHRQVGTSKDYRLGVGKDCYHHELVVEGPGMASLGQHGLHGGWIRVWVELLVLATHEDQRHERLVLSQVQGSRQEQALVGARDPSSTTQVL